MFRGREVELHVRVHDVLLVANRRLEEASITEGERVNVFIYQVFAFPAGEKRHTECKHCRKCQY